ncbi:DoxX family protein [Spongiivirga citrea]|uniref:Methylamine utilisation protein MauE domain-containing protein n=1 Tax=Spongiivirga citrea TaxID=1481457 RepID=A0A6M0CI80_9FLAO|nr:MauE/DoxX family redox-associated membrane protein [Spongiivirga citrea]NER17232.1 hypothetical protein [Spongiivirga citrea]
MHNISKYILALFFLVAGSCHFIDPGFYSGLIPDYLPYQNALNVVSGIVEIVLGLLVLFPKTRKIAGILLIAMLIIFIASHVHFTKLGSCIQDGLCIPEWISYIRLLVVHPILMIWVAKVCITPIKKHNIANANS